MNNKSYIKKLVKEAIESMEIQEMINDFMNAVRSKGTLSNYVEDDSYVEIEGNKYKYSININISNKPGFVKTRDEVSWPVDNASPAEYDIEGELEFDIEDIYVFDLEGNEVRDDLCQYLSNEQKQELYDAFDFDDEKWAIDADEYSNRHGRDMFDRADEWWDEHKMNESKKINITEQDILYMVKRAINEVTSKRKAWCNFGC